ncbi:twin-arginine translocase TatA/TatE family subunit [bacterium]|nr:twin-arginine translocase TatA/TatE family subunit [bacterium]
MPWNMGPWELGIILVIVILLFGAKRLPEMGKSLGLGIREFKKSISAINEDDNKKDSEKDAAKIEEGKEA